MSKRILAILLSLLVAFTVCCPLALAADEEGEIELTLDVNKRYTDISDEAVSDNLFLYGEQEEKEKDTKRNTYIVILSAALVVAVVILVISLKKVPKEDEIDISGTEIKNKKE